MEKILKWKTPNSYDNSFAPLPEKPGIYVLVTYTDNIICEKQKEEIAYIGSSKNLKKRLNNHPIHIKLYDIYWHVKTFFLTTKKYQRAEKCLIRRYRPPYNKCLYIIGK